MHNSRGFVLMLLSILVIASCTPPVVNVPAPTPPPPPIPGRWSVTCGGSGSEIPYGICRTSDGGYTVSGSTTSYWVGMADAWILKLDENGAVEWQRSYGSVYNQEFRDIRQTDDGGHIVAGSIERISTYTYEDAWILKLHADGTIAWQKKYSVSARSLQAEAIRQTPDGGFIVCGNTGYFNDWTAIVMKLDQSGVIEWQKTYEPGSGRGHCYSLDLTNDDGYIIAGYVYRPFGKGYDAWLLRLSSSGVRQWDAAYGTDGDDRNYSVLGKDDGGYVTAGRYGSGGGWILELAEDGTVLWQKRYGLHTSDRFIEIVAVPDGYAVGGERYRQNGTDLWMMTTTPDGELLHQAAYGSNSNESIGGLCSANDSGFVITGTLDSNQAGIPNNGIETWVINVPEDGQLDGALFMATETVSVEDTAVTRETIQGPVWVRDGKAFASDTSVLPLHTGGYLQILYPY